MKKDGKEIVPFSKDIFSNLLDTRSKKLREFFKKDAKEFIHQQIKDWMYVSVFNYESYRYGVIDEALLPGNYTITMMMTYMPFLTNFDRFVTISKISNNGIGGFSETILC